MLEREGNQISGKSENVNKTSLFCGRLVSLILSLRTTVDNAIFNGMHTHKVLTGHGCQVG